MKLIDGKELSGRLRAEMAERMPSLEAQYGRVPGLAVIIVGSNPASQTYVRNKVKGAAAVGMKSVLVELPEDVSEEVLLSKIAELNAAEDIDGVLVQLPLPAHICEKKVIDAIALEKDVDGFHPLNVARLWLGEECTLPCTPKGVMTMLSDNGIEFSGKKAVVIGRSNIVGKPMAKLLLDRNATVTIAHSRTADLEAVCSEADILVAAVGRPKFVKASMVKDGATVIDVGINRDPETGKLCGDVDFESVAPKAGYITPVPGGVGPMTITELFRNTIECFERRMRK